MRCAKVRELVSDYIDGLVSPRVRGELSEHFATCKSCASELETTSRVLAAVSGLKTNKAPVDLWPGVQMRMRSAPEHISIWRRFTRPALRPLIALPAAALGAAVTLMVVAHAPHQVAAPQYSVKTAAPSEVAAYVEEYSQFRSKQSFGDASSFVAARLETPSAKGE